MQITVARATQLCRRNVGTMGKFQCTQFSLLSGQTKNPLAIVVWMPRVTDQRWKIQGDVLHGILLKHTVPKRVTYCAFIGLQKFYSDHCLKYFCELPNNISFPFHHCGPVVERTNCKVAFWFGAIARKGTCTVISRSFARSVDIREFKITTTATATGTSLNKRFNKVIP